MLEKTLFYDYKNSAIHNNIGLHLFTKLGSTYSEMGLYDKAVLSFSNAIKYDYRNYNAYNNWGLTNIKL